MILQTTELIVPPSSTLVKAIAPNGNSYVFRALLNSGSMPDSSNILLHSSIRLVNVSQLPGSAYHKIFEGAPSLQCLLCLVNR